MDLIIETDIGHDPDDFFAICYLIAAGVNVKAILVSPGDPDQIAIARLITRELGLNIPIGATDLNRQKLSSGSIHHDLLHRYGRPLCEKADGLGHEIVYNIMEDDTRENVEAFIIGPVTNIGRFLLQNPRSDDYMFSRATMQGGFVPYSMYRPSVVIDKFEGKSHVPTFNLNGNREGAQAFLSANIPRQMVGKNVCHTILFDGSTFACFAPPPNRAAELFAEAANLYFARHDSKKFHDPTAAVCHLHPEIGTWVDGNTVKRQDGWTTVPGSDKILVDIDRESLWNRLSTYT